MESNQGEAKSLPITEESKSEDYDFMKKMDKDLQTLFDKLAQIEQLKIKLN